MKRTSMLLTGAILMLGIAAKSYAQNVDSREDEEAIRKIIVEMTESFNKHDASAATRMYTADADFVTVRGERAKGSSNIEKQLATIFATRAKDATQRTLNMTIRFIRPDIAIAHVTNELSGLVTADGQKPPPHQELSIRIFEKESRLWRVTAFHNTMISPFGGPTPSKP